MPEIMPFDADEDDFPDEGEVMDEEDDFLYSYSDSEELEDRYADLE